jgi:glutamate N-acetyltransferase/amino-acid N-acetyltransferase
MTSSQSANKSFKRLKGGNLASPKGFSVGATYVGMKTFGNNEKLDLAILFSEAPCMGAGIFTQNKFAAAPVHLSRSNLAQTQPRAIIVNSGCANAGVGEQGMIDAQEMTSMAADKLNLSPNEILIASTGVIGVELPMGIIQNGIEAINLNNSGHDFAKAIMTTDTHAKEFAVEIEIDGIKGTIAGAAKGVGMIHPDMATMLSFITTDLAIDPEFLQSTLKEIADRTFNMVSVDGDTSTNDTLIILANGLAENNLVEEGANGKQFNDALFEVCKDLTKMIARDGEGATKLLEVQIEDAQSLPDARIAARTITASPLLKAAIYGNDPNWGRVLMALGRSGAVIAENRVSIFMNDICMMEAGKPIPFFRDAAIAAMQKPEIVIRVQLGLGDGNATAWGCDLTEEYVHINGAYTT